MNRIITTSIFIFCTFFILKSGVNAQSTVSLDQVLDQVIDNSFASKSAVIQKDIVGAQYKFYKSLLKPNVSLSGSIPNFIKSSTPIIQPDGTISFQSIRQANGSLSVFASQVIPATGGTLFINSDIQRFDDLSLSNHQYNGIPLRAGISQPIFGFNPWKHEKAIQEFSLAEAQLNYNIQIEESLGLATDYYFNILIAKQNLEIANTNQIVNEKLLKITDERLLLGKVSKDEKLQLEIELNNAKLAVSQATTELDQAMTQLYTFLGITIPSQATDFSIPEQINISDIDINSLLLSSKKNRPEIMAFQKNKAMNKRDLAQAKADFGLQASLNASIGLARGSEILKEVYTDPFDEQRFNITLSIPILDWGKRDAATSQIELQQELIDASYHQRVLELENGIQQRGLFFSRLQNDITLLKEIMEKAEERFKISNERYVLGNLDITNLTLAQREKDQAKRNYINALKSYWVSYYEIRALSGFDVLNNQEIIYQ